MKKLNLILIVCACATLTFSFVYAVNEGESDNVIELISLLNETEIYEIMPVIEDAGISLSILIGDNQKEKTLHTFAELIVSKLKNERKKNKDIQFNNVAYSELLIEWYSFFNQSSSYTSILLRDVLKRCYLEYSVARLARGELVVVIDAELNKMTLSAKDLYSLRKPILKEIKKGSLLRDASESVWVSHGFTNVVDGYIGLGRVLPLQARYQRMTTSKLIKDPDNVLLALRILNTEQLRLCGFNIMVQFISRGGNLEKISLRDTSYFYQILSLKECSAIKFDALAKQRIGPSDILLLRGKLVRNAEKQIWMKQVFQ